MIMSTLFTALVAIIAIQTAGQTYDDCGTGSYTVGGQSLSMQVERDTANEEVRLTFNGPTDRWYGFVIGSGSMNGYAVTVLDSGTNLVERRVAKPSTSPTLTPSGTTTADSGTLTLVRPYTMSDSNYFDFTDLMTCQTDSISMAQAVGSGTQFSYHGQSNRNPQQSFTSTCTCPTPEPTTAEPTAVTQAPTTAEPTTAQPTSADATDEPTTAEPTTAEPTDVTMAPTTAEPTTAEPTDVTMAPTTYAPTMAEEEDTFEICGTAELFTGVSLTVERDTTNEMVRIEISGDSTKWFGYGFGSAVMTGSYGVVVQGADSDSLGVSQYILDKEDGPGESKTGGTSAVEVTDGIAVGTLKMGYAAGAFDFTDFLTCQVDSIDLIAAIGETTEIGYHGFGTDFRIGEQTLTRSSTCTCTGNNDASANNIFNGFYVMIAVFIGYIFM